MVLSQMVGCQVVFSSPSPQPEPPPPPPSQRISTTAFHAYAWDVPSTNTRNITPMLWFRRGDDPAAIAQQSKSLPPGRRWLFSWDIHNDLLRHPQDVCRDSTGRPTNQQGVWPEAGVRAVAEELDGFFRAYKAAGGIADALILDFEDNYSNWVIGAGENLDRWQAIQRDRRFPALSEKLGFSDLTTVAHFNRGTNYQKWNAVMGGVVDKALNDAVFRVARRYYPNIRASNYDSIIITPENAVWEYNGHPEIRAGIPFGTHQGPVFYSWIGNLRDKALVADKPFGLQPFSGVLQTVNRVRAIRRSSNSPMHAWIHAYFHRGDKPDDPGAAVAVVGKTPYYKELVVHLALHGISDFIFFNPKPHRQGQNPADFAQANDERILDEILTELNAKLGTSGREPLSSIGLLWDARVIASGMKTSRGQAWRFTLGDGVRSVRVQVNGAARTITPTAGEAGVWLELAAGETLALDPESGAPVVEIGP